MLLGGARGGKGGPPAVFRAGTAACPYNRRGPHEGLPLDYIFTMAAPQQVKLQSELSSAQESQH